MKKQFDIRILTVARILLFLLGASVGWLCMWQLFLAYPNLVRDGLKIVFDAMVALFTGALLALSARPIVAFIAYLVERTVRFSAQHKPIELVGLLLGVAVGLMIAVFAEVVMRLFLPIKAVRILLTVLIAVVACVVAAVAFVRMLLNPPDTAATATRHTGYIVHSSAFGSAKLETLLDWLNGEVYVSRKTVNALIEVVEGDSEPLIRFRRLETGETFRHVESSNKLSEDEEVARLALMKRLKVIAKGLGEGEPLGVGVKVLDIDSL